VSEEVIKAGQPQQTKNKEELIGSSKLIKLEQN